MRNLLVWHWGAVLVLRLHQVPDHIGLALRSGGAVATRLDDLGVCL